ncbi:MAG: oligosaccharide flippase family protein [Bacteroidales bacterium]|jgi:O-antigen/teichoic acid export membrane protein|nr:oligosaccharide flippase family protein [Bacteroidales bacterium]
MARRRFVRDIIGVFNSNVFSIIAGFLSSIILARVLGPDKYGIFTALVIIPIIVVSLTHLGVRGSAIFHVGKGKFEKNELVSSIIVLLIFASLLGMLISAIAYFIYDEPSFSMLMIGLLLLVIPSRLALVYFGGIFLGNDEINKANQMNWITNGLNLFLIALLVWGLGYEILGAIISFLVSGTLVSIYGYRMIRKSFRIRLRIHLGILKSLLRLGLLFSVSFFILQLNYRIDILLLEKLKDATEVGIYSIGASVAEQLWQLPLAVGIVVFSRTANSKDKAAMAETTGILLRIAFLLSIVLAVAIYFLVPVLVPLIFGDAYMASIRIIQLILPGIIMVVIFRILSGHLAGLGRPEITLYVFLPALVINILLNLLWIPEYGGRGAAMATNVSYAAGSIGYMIFYSRIVKTPLLKILAFRKSDFTEIRQLLKSLRK